MKDLNPNAHIDPQLQSFVDYFDRMKKEASPEDYQTMLQDVRDTCELRLKAIGVDYGKKKSWWRNLFGE